MPKTAFIAVDLPAPFGPTITAIWPFSTAMRAAVQDVDGAIAAGHRLADQEGLSHAGLLLDLVLQAGAQIGLDHRARCS